MTNTAGILVYRHRAATPEVFLVHPGGPFWAKKDHGAWSIPKGEFPAEEEALDAKQDRLEDDAERRMMPIVDVAIRSGVAKRYPAVD